MFGSESSRLRLSKPEKCEFTYVNDHFEGKYNENIGLYGQTFHSEYPLYYIVQT